MISSISIFRGDYLARQQPEQLQLCTQKEYSVKKKGGGGAAVVALLFSAAFFPGL
jgi:hypothetical protein